MSEWDAHGAEQILWINRHGIFLHIVPHLLIPLHNLEVRMCKFVLFSVWECTFLIVIANLHLTLWCHAIDSLIMEHTTIVLEEYAILSCNVYQHSRHTIGTRAIYRCTIGICAYLIPYTRIRSSCVHVT